MTLEDTIIEIIRANGLSYAEGRMVLLDREVLQPIAEEIVDEVKKVIKGFTHYNPYGDNDKEDLWVMCNDERFEEGWQVCIKEILKKITEEGAGG